MRRSQEVLLRVVVGLLVCASIEADLRPLRAEAGPGAAPAADGTSAVGIAAPDRVQLEAFVDEFFAAHMGPLHVPGASFALVKDGELVLAKGFGYSNLEKRVPVVADQTLFDVQSVTKLFTVMAVMQAAERGILRLDDEVNRHLKTFQLEETFPQPVRLFHLMTHTSGLEDQGVGITARQESDALPLGAYLAKSLPSRVTPPGRSHVVFRLWHLPGGLRRRVSDWRSIGEVYGREHPYASRNAANALLQAAAGVAVRFGRRLLVRAWRIQGPCRTITTTSGPRHP